jgi:hypothetical protein
MVLLTDENVHDGQNLTTKGTHAPQAPLIHTQGLSRKMTNKWHRVRLLYKIYSTAVITIVLL